MTDLLARLRAPLDPDDPDLWQLDKDRLEAAERIEALERALSEIGEICLSFK